MMRNWIILLSILAGGESFAPALVPAAARCSCHCRLLFAQSLRGQRGRGEEKGRGRAGGILQGVRCAREGARRVWQNTGKKAAEFSSNNGLIYLRSFLPKDVFSEVSRECSRTSGKLSPERSSFASGRKGAYMPKDGENAPPLALSARKGMHARRWGNQGDKNILSDLSIRSVTRDQVPRFYKVKKRTRDQG
jgi:hypothetical protein